LENPLILASLSPRREYLLRIIGYPFQVQGSCIDEEKFAAPLPQGVERPALEKARQVAGLFTRGYVLGADTMVELNGELMGKPSGYHEAENMMRKLSGKEHRVFTGLALVDAGRDGREIVEHEVTRVHFAPIEERCLQAYLQTEDWKGKAGAYAIQGQAGVFVEKVEGCYFNVVGLPLHRTYRMLTGWGLPIFQYWGKGDGISKTID